MDGLLTWKWSQKILYMVKLFMNCIYIYHITFNDSIPTTAQVQPRYFVNYLVTTQTDYVYVCDSLK